MGPHVERLLALAGPPLGGPPAKVAGVPDELNELLVRCNGFVAFESALHVFPLTAAGVDVISLDAWNARDLWRAGR